MRTRLLVVVAAVGLVLASAPARAHHAFGAEFDQNKPVKVRGTVVKWELTNPHSWIHIDVKGPDGKSVTWMIEGAGPNNLYRLGFTKESLPPGTEILLILSGAGRAVDRTDGKAYAPLRRLGRGKRLKPPLDLGKQSKSSLFGGPALRFRQSEEELSAVSKGNVSADAASRPVLRLVALDQDLGSRRQRLLREAESVEIVRAGAFDHPGDRFAIRALHVDVNPGVRVGQFPLHDRPPHLDRLVLVEFRPERMMRPRRRRRQNQAHTGDDDQ